MKKKPRFFCDNCGHEVIGSTRSCPHCGRYFASVRCPACSFSGEDKLFLKGCPSCGYSDPAAGERTGKQQKRKTIQKYPSGSVYFIILIVLLIIVLFSYLITR